MLQQPGDPFNKDFGGERLAQEVCTLGNQPPGTGIIGVAAHEKDPHLRARGRDLIGYFVPT